ncbi:MAG TPA: GGDEF domain-containing protein, partial [Micromonospora sp.]
MLVVTALLRDGDRRRGDWLLAWGAGGVTVSMTLALFGLVALTTGLGRDGLDPMIADLVAVGLALSGLLLCAGLLRLPGATGITGTTGTTTAALRLVLDGLVIATSAWFVGWVLLSEPTRLLRGATPSACTGIVLTSVTAAVTFGVALVVVMRSSAPRAGLALAASGVLTVTGGGLGLAVGVCQGVVDLGLTSAVVLSAGLLMVAVGGRSADAPAVDSDMIRRGTAYAFLPMLAMSVSGMHHVLAGGKLTVAGLVAASVEGFALVARQAVALRDVRGYANRLIEREAHFRELAHTDPLTGLANRRGLLRALHQVDPADSPWV